MVYDVDGRAVSVAAMRSAQRANWIACASLVATIASAFFTFQQARSAQDANALAASLQAQNVYIDVPQQVSGKTIFWVKNRNSLPVSDVSVKYTFDGADPELYTYIGQIPGCSTIAINGPKSDSDGSIPSDKPGFAPLIVFYTDPSGRRWERDAFGALIESTREFGRKQERVTYGDQEPIPSCGS